MRSSCGINRKCYPIKSHYRIKEERCSITPDGRIKREKEREGALLDEV